MSKQDVEINWKNLKDSNNTTRVNDKIIVKHKKKTLFRSGLEIMERRQYQTKQDFLDAIKSCQLEILEDLIYKFGNEIIGTKYIIPRGYICLQQKTLTFR